MNPKLSARVLVALSILYGVSIGVIAILGVPESVMVTFSIVGVMVLGALWVVRGLFTRS